MKNRLDDWIKRSPLVLVLVYTIIASAWLVLNKALLGLTPLDSRYSLLVGDVLLIAASSGLLYWLLWRWRRQTMDSAISLTASRLKSQTPLFFILFICLLLIVPLVSLGVNYFYAPKMEQAAYKNLHLVAKIKLIQFERWREARLGDAKVISADRSFAELVDKLQLQGFADARQRIEERFDAMLSAYDFEGITLFDPAGNELITRGGRVSSENVKRMLFNKTISSGKPEFSDLYIVGNDRVQLDLISPISLKQKGWLHTIGYVVIHTGVDRQILPRVISWPSASSSAEILIVKTEDGYESLIHGGRVNKRQTTITLRPLGKTSLYMPHSQDFGLDYLGKPALTAQESISMSDWRMVTQIDQAEVMAPLDTLLALVSATVMVAISLISIALIMLLRQQRRTLQLELIAESSERDRLLKRFYDMPFIGMAVIDPQSNRWLQANEKLCEILGYSRDELLKLTWQEVTHPDDLAADQIRVEQLIKGEIEQCVAEKRYLHKSGKTVIARVEKSCIRNPAGEPQMMLLIVEDITERKAAQDALKASEERLNLVFQATNDGWWDLDLVNDIAYHSPRWWGMLGYGPDQDDIDPMLWRRITHPDDLEKALHYIRSILVSKQNSYELELRLQHRDGHYVPVLTRALITRDASGNPVRISGANRDLTESKAAEAALLASEALYREMFDANPHPMWVFDRETLRFVAVNDAAVDHYGWTREEFLAMSILDIRPPEDVDRLNEYLPSVFEQNIKHSGVWQHIRKDGSIIDVDITSHPLEFNGRQARLVLAYDITQRLHNEQEVQILNRLLLMLTNINQTIVHRLPPEKILQEACTIAVRDGKFRMAWIGLIDDDGIGVREAASAGETGDYIDNLKLDMRDTSKNGPSPRAIREGRHVICNDIATDESIAPWRDKALANGYRAMVAEPLIVNGKIIGNFSFYAAETGMFNQREIELLDELAGDIAFALEVAEAEQARQTAEDALRESEVLFHTLASSSPVGIFRTNHAGDCVYVNQAWVAITGTSEADAIGGSWIDNVHSEDKAVLSAWRLAVQQRRPFNEEYRYQRPDGSIVWVKGQAVPEADHQGKPTGYVGTITDITAIKLSEENLRMSSAVFENTREGIMVTDADCKILKVNQAFCDITRFSEVDVLGKKPQVLASGRHDRIFFDRMWQSLQEIDHWQGELWNRRKNGDIHPVLMSISVIRNVAGEISNYIGVFADISNIKASEAQLEFLAHHDPLTRLPNRLMLISRLSHAIEVARRDNSQLALLMLDLDRFKNVNDSFGHLTGDELLQQVAKRLISKLRGVDTVTRLGGDEFTVLLEDIANPEDAARVAENIISALEAPWKLSNNIEVRIGASIGISLYPGHGDSALELLQHADAALYQAKAAGRGCARYFSESLTQAARDRFNIEARLRQAIVNDELRVYYQPKLEIESGRIIGAEALVRWPDPQEGLIAPMRFIPVAEETGLIAQIGQWVLREACTEAKRWLDAGLPSLSVAVNLSAHQLHHSDIVKTVREALEISQLPAEHLELELTESTLMQRETEIVETLNILRSLGVSIAIDDFGTGYSSLSYLKNFPLDVLKIDRGFVTDIEQDQDNRAITTTIIGIAHTLGMRVVAEGVETEEQLDFLRSQHCDIFQGYLLSKPIPAEEFMAFFQQYESAS